MWSVEILGFLGGGIGVFFGLPQMRRVYAMGHGIGVSLLAWVLLFAVSASWMAYGIRIGSLSLIITNLAAGLINGSVVVAVAGRRARTLLLLALLAAGLSAFVLYGPRPLVSAELVLLMLGQLPQVRASFASWRTHRPSAVSMPAMQISLLSLLCWEAYAVAAHDTVILLTTTLGLILNLAIIGAELMASRVRATGVVVRVGEPTAA